MHGNCRQCGGITQDLLALYWVMEIILNPVAGAARGRINIRDRPSNRENVLQFDRRTHSELYLPLHPPYDIYGGKGPIEGPKFQSTRLALLREACCNAIC